MSTPRIIHTSRVPGLVKRATATTIADDGQEFTDDEILDAVHVHLGEVRGPHGSTFGCSITRRDDEPLADVALMLD